MVFPTGDLVGLEITEVDGIDGDSTVPPRTAPVLPALPELSRLTRSRSILSTEGVGEFR